MLVQVCERIARELRSGYTIGYPPPDRDARMLGELGLTPMAPRQPQSA